MDLIWYLYFPFLFVVVNNKWQRKSYDDSFAERSSLNGKEGTTIRTNLVTRGEKLPYAVPRTETHKYLSTILLVEAFRDRLS